MLIMLRISLKCNHLNSSAFFNCIKVLDFGFSAAIPVKCNQLSVLFEVVSEPRRMQAMFFRPSRTSRFRSAGKKAGK